MCLIDAFSLLPSGVTLGILQQAGIYVKNIFALLKVYRERGERGLTTVISGRKLLARLATVLRRNLKGGDFYEWTVGKAFKVK